MNFPKNKTKGEKLWKMNKKSSKTLSEKLTELR